MTPQTVDAYNGSLRDIVFPAAILQAPGFDPVADSAVNYGAAGWGAAHELTHGFDTAGRTIDAKGALRDWWTNRMPANSRHALRCLARSTRRTNPCQGYTSTPISP